MQPRMLMHPVFAHQELVGCEWALEAETDSSCACSQEEYTERCDRWIETRPWTKCIVIIVGTPDDL